MSCILMNIHHATPTDKSKTELRCDESTLQSKLAILKSRDIKFSVTGSACLFEVSGAHVTVLRQTYSDLYFTCKENLFL